MVIQNDVPLFCVGGPMNGQRVSCSSEHMYALVKSPLKMNNLYEIGPFRLVAEPEKVRYSRRLFIRPDREREELWVLDCVPDEEVTSALIDRDFR